MKKQGFNKAIKDLMANKALFFHFVRRPSQLTVDGILMTLQQLKEVQKTPEYVKMKQVSGKRTEEQTELMDAKRGQQEFQQGSKCQGLK